ncbi:MAG: hypothetical protein FOGNACKC_00905 [Anaerolineae bacterium]|nr:hypothetical protein [Anaerolineae bacterium]
MSLNSNPTATPSTDNRALDHKTDVLLETVTRALVMVLNGLCDYRGVPRLVASRRERRQRGND